MARRGAGAAALGGRIAGALALGALLLAAPAAPAQTPVDVPPGAQILTLNWEELYDGSAWGKRVQAEIAAEGAALTAENNRIADDLVAEEKALTDRRAGMEPAAFRTEAQAFDKKATEIRAAQNAKAEALNRRFEAERQAFIAALVPLLDGFLAEHKAAMVIDRRVIIRALAGIDVTDELIALADEKLGAGQPAATPATPE